MAHSPQIRNALRSAYVYERLSVKAAAERHGVNYQTARRWKSQADENGDDWDKARAASRIAAGGMGDLTTQVLEDFALLFQTTIDDLNKSDIGPLQKAETIAKLSDSYNKTIKAAGAADPKFSKLAVAMQVLEELAKFIRDDAPEQMENFVEILEPFGARVSEVFG